MNNAQIMTTPHKTGSCGVTGKEGADSGMPASVHLSRHRSPPSQDTSWAWGAMDTWCDYEVQHVSVLF